MNHRFFSGRQRLLVSSALLGSIAAPNVWAQAEEQIPQVVVTASLIEQKLEDAPASITVIGHEELNNRPVQDLADALVGAAGVHVGGVGLGRRGISIRGMSNEYTLTMIDGRRISQTASVIGHSEADVGWIPTEGIERIEVVRGPMSSLYGSDALGGVINIITRPATDEWRASMTSRGEWREDGRGGEVLQTGLYASGPLVKDKLGIVAYGEFRDREPTVSPTDARLSEMEGREVLNGNLAFNWTPDDAQRISLNYGQGSEERERNALTGRNYYVTTDLIDREQFALSHMGSWQWGETSVRAYGTKLEKTNRRSSGTAVRPQILEDRTYDARTTLNLGASNRLSLGGEWREEELFDTSMNSEGYDSVRHRAVFVQDELELDRWLLVLGTRYDDHDIFGGYNSPRAYAVYHATDQLTFKGGVGRGFKAPNLKVLSPEYSVTTSSFVVFGNPNLEPEFNTSYELGAHYRADGWSLQATLFQNDVKDLIQSYCAADCDALRVLNYENVDEARIRGIEIATSFAPLRQLALDLNYTFLNAKDLTADQPLAEKPKHAANLTLKWLATDKLNAQVRGNYYGKQTMYASEVRYGLPDYTLWGADLNYRLTQRFKLHLSGDNLTDESLAELSTRFDYVEVGRSYSAGFTGSF
ncbi:TonB-dependent receptor domain-containing protein [Steroidobacter agaridevorans]|uniref:TonB-dependent receptor domain-containing protein n=1 Tax=Steroidobacter agaridevorans TaxID=2695856 RepID=UPI0013226F8C|nr:TonB-dependent receptor [Steroidobacter agaridevorans]GFE91718.1 TonB-dependent receptor [Steroidobacter agaridevorans]